MFKDSLKTIALSLIILSIVGAAYAGPEPTVSPPQQDPTISKPLTESGTGQTKKGGLWIGENAAAVANNGGKGLIVENGKVGIGTASPKNTLDLRGQLNIQDSTNNAAVIYFPNTGTLPGFYIRSDDNPSTWEPASERLFIGANGKVGIGTTSPRGGLEVNINGAAAYWDGVVGNYGADTYSDIGWQNWQDWQANQRDTCDSNSFATYACDANESRSCLDYHSASYYYQNRVSTMARDIVCKKETKMQMITVDKIE